MHEDHKDKIALVFGAGSGIGRGVAFRFASEGIHLLLSDISAEAIEETARDCVQYGVRVETKPADISKVEDIESAVSQCVKAFGRLDYMVNAAGIVQARGFLEVEVQDWDRIIAVNQTGAAFASQIAGRQMVKQLDNVPKEQWKRSNGKIVNFASIAGRRGKAVQLHYGASKAAVISITQTAANALAPYNINVNAVSPSIVLTPMWEKHIAEKAKTLGKTIDEANEEMVQIVPLKRVCSVEEMAGAVSFLCSEDADFITGQTLNVDGGVEMN